MNGSSESIRCAHCHLLSHKITPVTDIGNLCDVCLSEYRASVYSAHANFQRNKIMDAANIPKNQAFIVFDAWRWSDLPREIHNIAFKLGCGFSSDESEPRWFGTTWRIHIWGDNAAMAEIKIKRLMDAHNAA